MDRAWMSHRCVMEWTSHKETRNKDNLTLKKQLRRNLWLFVKYGKGKSIKWLVGQERDILRNHLESKFKPGMTWANYGLKGWEIDHVKPCKLFNLECEKQRKSCFDINNLQPLWMSENRRKSASH